MKVKTIPSSWINRIGRRLDSGPYISDGLEYRMRLDQLALHKDRLVEVTENGTEGIFIAPYFKRNYIDDPQHGVPLLGNTHILMADPLLTAPLIPKRTYEQFRQGLHLKAGWTLITCFGTVGNMAYCRPDMESCAGSTNFMRVVSDTDKIASGYLYAFLSSKFGRALITQSETGSVIPNLLPSHIADLPVPRLGAAVEQRTHALVEEAAQLRTRFQDLLNRATEKFLSDAGISDMPPHVWHEQGADLGFAATVGVARLLRATNYSPRIQKIIHSLAMLPHRTLGEICRDGYLNTGARFKRIDCEPELGVRLIGQKQGFWMKPEGRWISARHAPSDIYATDETVMIASSGTLGENELYCRPIFVTGTWQAHVYTQHFLRVVSGDPEISGAYLFAFLRSELAFRCLRSMSTGSKQQEIHLALLSRFPIPILGSTVKHQIESDVREAYILRDEADRAEDEAVRLVEQAIEEAT